MNRHHYEFFGELLVAVAGEGGRTARQYRQMYDHYRVDSPDREPDVVIEETDLAPEPEVVLGDPESHYGWTGEEFVVRNGDDVMLVEPGWDRLRVSPGFEPFNSVYPVEFWIRRRKAEAGRALLHASAVRIDGRTTLFPAWRSAGKTNTLLSLLQDGADFLSDDRLWVGADGTALGYPLWATLQPFNAESFEEISRNHDSLQDRLRFKTHEFIDGLVEQGASRPETAIALLNESLLGENGREFVDITSIFAGADTVERAEVDNVMFLEAAPGAEQVMTERISTDRAVAAASAISNFEWDGQLREYFHAYDSLVEGGAMVEALDEVIRQERTVFRELFEGVPTYRARVPREHDWSALGLDDAMADTVAALETA
jgi:hypothetical protein